MRLPARALTAHVLAAAIALGGCHSNQVVSAAGGTRSQAREVVRVVYAQDGADLSARLPYAAGDIAPAVRRMIGRFAQLRSAFEAGSAGVTSEGYVALRDAAAAGPELRVLVRRENLDRSILYGASALEVGHGINDQYGDWMPFERESFALEWVAQAPAGWWHRTERGAWVRKAAEPSAQPAPAQRR